MDFDFLNTNPTTTTQPENTNPPTEQIENNNNDLNDFQPFPEVQSEPPKSGFSNLDDMMNQNFNTNQKIDSEEQKRVEDRQREADERRAKITKKMEEEERLRQEIRKKASEYLLEFETQRQEAIAKRRQELEKGIAQKNNQNSEGQGTADTWGKVTGNIDLKDSEYKGSKDVSRMKEAMMNRNNDPNAQPLQNFFG